MFPAPIIPSTLALAFLAPFVVASPPTKPTPPAPAVDNAALRAATAPAADASNAFGLDLFRSLAAASPKDNLFISPYSVSVALTMAAEGARGETESEMAKVLHFPMSAAADARRIDAINSAHAALRSRYQSAGQVDPAVKVRLDDLRRQLDEANDKAKSLQSKQKWGEASRAAATAQELASQLNALQATVSTYDLRTANALWVEQSFDLKPDYVHTIDRFYGSGGVTPLDFARNAEASRLRINAWVEDHTEKRIKDLLPPGSLTADTRLVIANAVYFKGQWASPFHESATRDEDFTLADGSTARTRLMHDAWRSGVPYAAFNADGSFFETPHKVPREESARPATYPDADGFSMIELPYQGGDLSMLVLLPRSPGGLESLEKNLTADALSGWLAKLDQRTVDTALPRFKMEYEQELSRPLKALGMRRAFISPGQPDEADFTGIADGPTPSQRVYIGLVQHKAWVEVNERGTEAAAATAIAMRDGAAAKPVEMIPFNPVFRADHPFIFAIRDTRTGVILFLGRVSKPAA